jgi:gliding motility-associated-like protein
MKRISILVFAIFISISGLAQVVINEYSCSNVSTVVDAYGQREDWVELFNTTGAAVSLSGMYLSDDKYAPQKWQIPAGVTIPSNGRMMVFCSDRGVYFGGQLHPSFQLTQTKGEYFVLANSSGTIIDSVQLIPAQSNHSRGRKTDGSNLWGIFNVPTPNAPNANAKDFYATRPIFSVAPGFYNSTQSLVISSPDPNITIHYTNDGSTPTAASPTYTGPISIPATVVIRAIAFSSSPTVLPSFCETNTYLINENTTMNVVSVCGPYNTLFTSAQTINNTFEFFDKNKQFRFEFQGQTKKHGNDSWAYPQKGFRVYVRDNQGYDYAMKHKFFNTSLRDTFPVIIMKAGASDNYPGNAGNPGCHIRDVFAHTLAYKYNLEMDGRKYEPAIVFINGQYWGVYEIRERVDGDYTEYYYNQPEKKVDILRYWGGLTIVAGSDTGWVNLYNYIMANNMAVPANYNHVTQFLNVKSLAQYFIYNTWLVNSDWLNWNTMWWRGRKGSGVKWRYALWDEDNIMGLGENFTGLGTTSYQNDPCQPFNLFQNNSSIKHTDMLVRLMNNPNFSQLYRNTFIDMLNGPLNCDNMLPHFDSLIAIIQPEMQRHCTRWNGNYSTWQANVLNMRNQIVGRCAVIAQKLDSCMDLNPQRISYNVSPANAGTIQMGGTTVSPYVWSRIIEADTILNLSTTPSNGYYFFDHWEKYEVQNTFSPDSLTSSVAFNFKKKDSVVAFFKYINLDSVNVTFDVTPPGKGTITIDNFTIPSYPSTIKLDRRNTYSLTATPNVPYNFFNWRKQKSTSSFAPTAMDDKVSFKFNLTDTIVANFQYNPPPPGLPTAPELPSLDQTLTVPTAFSPNGDGLNDVFQITIGKNVKAVDLRIYDRWGNEVFKATDSKFRWDGTYKGELMPIGTYFYVLNAWFDNGYLNSNRMYKGEIALIR